MASVPPKSPTPPQGVIPIETRRKSEMLVAADPAPPPEERSGGQLGYLAQRDFLYGLGGSGFSARRMTINQRYELRADAIIALANLAAMAPMLTAKWYVKCRHPAKAKGLEEALRRIYGPLIMGAFEAVNFGWQAQVKEFGFMRPSWEYIDRDDPDGPKVKPVWDNGEIPMLVWEPFVNLRPETVEPLWDAKGRFDGIRVSGTGPLSFASVEVPEFTGGTGGRKVPVEFALWVVNNRHGSFGSAWGQPRTMHAFKFWRAGELVLRILERSAEHKGDPLTIVSYPSNGSIEWEGRMVPNQQAANIIARRAKAGTILVMPSDLYDDGTSGKGGRQWSIEYVKAEEKIDSLIAILKFLDVAKMRAMGMAEQGLIEGGGESSNRNVAKEFGERNNQSQFAFQTEIVETINRYMIPQLSEQNWPWLRDEPAEFVVMPFGNEGQEILSSLIKSKANSDAGGLPIDYSAALEYFNIPTLSTEAIVEAERRMAEAVKEQASGVEVKPDERGNAGREADTGFYYGAPERINLSTGSEETEAQTSVLASLPATRHFEDGHVLAQVVVIRRVWFDLLTQQYESLARHLEADSDVDLSDLDLADSNEKRRRRRIAQRIVDSWEFESKRVARAIERTRRAVGAIFARAGRLELGRASLPASSWDPGDEKLTAWLNDHVASRVTKIERTTREQLRDFLVSEFEADRTPKQVADNLRRHFSEVPSWRADLIAREETASAYRAATLFAAEAAGAKQVQALDARLGPDRSDPECISRDGELMTIAQAWKAIEGEHVRGTLAFRITPGGATLALKRVEEPPEDDRDWAARVDLESSTIYVNGLAKVAPEEMGEYLVMAVDYVESRAR
jgi:hypothetical protein